MQAVNAANRRASEQRNRSRVKIDPTIEWVTHKRDHIANSSRVRYCRISVAERLGGLARLPRSLPFGSQAERRAERSADLSAGQTRLRMRFAISGFLRAVAHPAATPEEIALEEHNKTKSTAMGPKEGQLKAGSQESLRFH